MADGSRPALHLPVRNVRVPTSASKEAQAVLALGLLGPPTQYPELCDNDAWRQLIADHAGGGFGTSRELRSASTSWSSSASPVWTSWLPPALPVELLDLQGTADTAGA